MSIFLELARLEALYAASLINPLSCPRDRKILRTKIDGLEKEVSRRQPQAPTPNPASSSWSDAQHQQDDMRLWEQEQVR